MADEIKVLQWHCEKKIKYLEKYVAPELDQNIAMTNFTKMCRIMLRKILEDLFD